MSEQLCENCKYSYELWNGPHCFGCTGKENHWTPKEDDDGRDGSGQE